LRSPTHKPASPCSSAVSDATLRMPFFTAEDVPQLVSVAGRPLVPGIAPASVAGGLNLAFFGAYVTAEQARVDLPRAELRGQSDDIINKTRQTLRALGLPTEPHFYTKESMGKRGATNYDLYRQSAIAHRLRRTIYEVAPLPALILPPDFEQLGEAEQSRVVRAAINAEHDRPLTRWMVPTSIARAALPADVYRAFIYPHAQYLVEKSGGDLSQVQARLAVELLLSMAPAAMALLIALAENVAQDAASARTNKQNYSREFREILFYWLAKAYFRDFGVVPNIKDSERLPEGPAALWLTRILHVAAERSEKIRPTRAKGGLRSERDRLIAEIQAVTGLAQSVKAKRFAAAWRQIRRDNPGLRLPK
jgi:hypothetical protein